MQLSMGLRVVLVLLSSVLLSACLVGKDTTKDYTITLPSKLPTYGNGHYINFGYELYQVPSSGFTTSTQGGIEMTWRLSSVSLPFGLGWRTEVMQQQIKENTVVDGERYSIQYLKQDSNGSVLLNAFKGITTSSSYWPDLDGVLATPQEPETKTIFSSPIDDGAGTSLVGVPQHLNKALDFYVMGATCNESAGSGNCAQVAQFNFSDYTIVGIDNIVTPLGNMETYRLHYSGIMSPTMVISETAYFDYRVSCGTPGSLNPVNFVGDVWIYPPIGPVKLQNLCSSGARVIKFIAQITSTNLPH